MVIITSACTVKVAAPDKPITINLNVKIEHEVRIKVEKELDDLLEDLTQYQGALDRCNMIIFKYNETVKWGDDLWDVKAARKRNKIDVCDCDTK